MVSISSSFGTLKQVMRLTNLGAMVDGCLSPTLSMGRDSLKRKEGHDDNPLLIYLIGVDVGPEDAP